MKAIWFDMDGTIADLYQVENWLEDLRAYNPRPYKNARPLVNMQVLARTLNKLRKEGFTINIVSWTSKVSTDEYDKQIARAKRAWLKKHLASVVFDKIDIIPYGTPKGKNRTGILFDDECANRKEWMKKETNIMLYIISAILGVVGLILIVISIVGEFKSNWGLTSGLGCVALGSSLHIISMIKNKKKQI